MSADRAAALQWLREPAPAIALLLLLIAGFWHMTLGLQVVIEDYLHAEWLKLSALILNRLVAVALAIAGIFAVLRIAFGG